MSGAIQSDQWAPIISTATLLVPLQIPGAQHVVSEVELASVGALRVGDNGDRKFAEEWRHRRGVNHALILVASIGPLAPPGYGVIASHQQFPLGQVFGWEAYGDDATVQGN